MEAVVPNVEFSSSPISKILDYSDVAVVDIQLMMDFDFDGVCAV